MPRRTMSYTFTHTTSLSMGLYDDEIDWDADLFSQIGNKSADNTQDVVQKDALDDSQWGMEQTKSTSNMKSMRDQMKKSWGGDGKEEEGKPTADWMPGFGSSGPDEDEPWFTG